MSAPILKALTALGSLTPRPPAPEYDGLEYKWKAFIFRPAEFKVEAVLLGIVLFYIGWYFVGASISNKRAKASMDPYVPLLKDNFTGNKPLSDSGPAQHLLYSTGRRNTVSLHGTLTLLPIHDLFGLATYAFNAVLDPTFEGSEGLTWELTLGRGEQGLQSDGLGVWAVVEKNQIKRTRDKRWDLTFPKIQENAAVPSTHVLFTEHSDANDVALKTPNVGLAQLLADPASLSVLKYFLVTDQPSKRPTKGPLAARFKTRKIVIALRKPVNDSEIEATKAWLQVAFNLADVLAKPNVLKPEVARKLTATRKEVEKTLGASYAKEQAEDNPPELTAEEKRFQKKKKEREAMSDKERKKLEELDKKREMRKMQKKSFKGQ